jgi:hypothetical protein
MFCNIDTKDFVDNVELTDQTIDVHPITEAPGSSFDPIENISNVDDDARVDKVDKGNIVSETVQHYIESSKDFVSLSSVVIYSI